MLNDLEGKCTEQLKGKEKGIVWEWFLFQMLDQVIGFIKQRIYRSPNI